MTLILACIIYWQAKKINRVVLECDPEGNRINLKLMEHISPIRWDNVILLWRICIKSRAYRGMNSLAYMSARIGAVPEAGEAIAEILDQYRNWL